ncbi:MAG: SDR family NAD(P)-dependent oxidoreductase [Proteobacteria bacterium]|nr:SDR family NAD(P)-dependent oxidoreductase [Pseudomonadota bacterium]
MDNFLTGLLEKVTKLPRQKLHANKAFEKFGINSIMISNLNRELEETFGDISKTLFFEYRTIAELSDYFYENHQEQIVEVFGQHQPKNTVSTDDSVSITTSPTPTNPRFQSLQKRAKTSVGQFEGDNSGIAIIGLSGHYPQAENLAEFWSNLKQGLDCVTEIPKDRWDYESLFDTDKSKLGSSYTKWGGFLNRIDRFDPLFFNISPREAETIDPQERLFLQTVWETVENAGYRRDKLNQAKVGVFVGVMYGWYQLVGAEDLLRGENKAGYTSYSSIANRISYWMNFDGPSIALDTMCSSSLTAIHLAMQSIRSGDCELAVAGGVNLMTHPNKYLQLSQSKFAASDGKCRAFGTGGDGYVPGEGVGAVLLKPLEKAMQDEDFIYAVVKGSGVNHDGKTNGYTVPNPNAQCSLISEVLEKADVDASSISYLEAHGTGTVLGDPIEINALKKAYASYTDAKQYCSIGSVKSNVGHLESAAGMSALTKVILQMKHSQLVPSLHTGELNPNINFEKSPFYVQKELSEWVPENSEIKRAGISSFGAGGSNAHLIVEDYPQKTAVESMSHDEPLLFVLSAKTKNRLADYVRTFNQFLSDLITGQVASFLPGNLYKLSDVIYTLQTGREAMEERIAIVFSEPDELIDRLDQWLADQQPHVDRMTFQGSAKMDENADVLISGEEGKAFVDTLIKGSKLDKLAQLWVGGTEIDWELLWTNNQLAESAKRVPLPTYPFEKERCWVLPEGEYLVPLPGSLPSNEYDEQLGLPATPSADLPSIPENSYYTLEKSWNISGPAGEVRGLSGIYVCLVGESGQAYQSELQKQLSGAHLVFVNAATDVADGLNPFQAESGKTLAEKIVSRNTPQLKLLDRGLPISGLIDLTDLDEEATDIYKVRFGKISLLQELIRYQRELSELEQPLELIHFTRGLQLFEQTDVSISKVSLSGSDMAGLYKMLSAEYRHVAAKTIDLDANLENIEKDVQLIVRELSIPATDQEVCYRKGDRYVPRIKKVWIGSQVNADQLVPPPLDKEKVFVVTGGTRGIGSAVAGYLAEKGVKHLVLMGAQPLPGREQWKSLLETQSSDQSTIEKIRQIVELEKLGARVELFTGSLSDIDKLNSFFHRIKQQLGPIGGVVHCAGLSIRKNPAFINKQNKDIARVLEPKIGGLVTLSKVLKDEPIDHFILFSSVSSWVAPLAVSLSDYTMANSFMNDFAAYQRSLGNDQFQSIIWPNWREIGMGEIKSPVNERLGLQALSTRQGLDLFEVALSRKERPVMMAGVTVDRPLVPELLTAVPEISKTKKSFSGNVSKVTQPKMDAPGRNRSLDWLVNLFSSELKIKKDKLDVNTHFEKFGVDSIIIAELIKRVESELDSELDPSIIINYPTLHQLDAYLNEHHQEEVKQAVGFPEAQSPQEFQFTNTVSGPQKSISVDDHSITSIAKRSETASEPGKIAVIGMACHFPGAENKDKFWQNLSQGVSSIGIVPELRWKANEWYQNTHAKGKSISKWGGFIDQIDYFDADYFGFTELQATQCDPLIRQSLEVTVQTLKDAGYEKEELWGRRVGMFMGSRVSNYAERIADFAKDSITGTGQNFITAHISQMFNLTGPSLVVDTACSSSLVALHLACQSLFAGESEMALAGGVDILLDEKPYLNLSEGKALSPDGKCHTFDEKANGFVPGEGCGMVLLKSLDQALADGDRIYAVIDGSAINNDGHTMGITTPNPRMQKDVIQQALNKGDISAKSISFVETHGTGTMIGDPIELKALTEVFSGENTEKGVCAVGSVKTNIGHLLSAAGIASFIKVILSIQQAQIPPTLNCETPNPRFDFAASPFYPVTELSPWEPREGVRRAAISSFGFGGTNAHLLVGECPREKLQGYQQTRFPLPAIEFQRKRFWLEKTNTAKKPVGPEVTYESLLKLEYRPERSNSQGKNLNVVTHVKNNHFIMRDHRVHDVSILPGVTFLDILLRVFRDKGFDLPSTQIKDVLFSEAVATTNEYSRQLEIALEVSGNQGKISVDSQKILQGQVEGIAANNLKANLYLNQVAPSKQIDIAALKNQAGNVTEMDELYGHVRNVGITHYEFMKGSGQVYQHNDYVLADLRLSQLAGRHLDSFHIHPAFLDSATIVPLLFFVEEFLQAQPVIPIYIESFQLVKQPGARCYVYIERRNCTGSLTDIAYSDIELFDEQGQILARLNRVGVKEIRTKELITKHRTDGSDMAASRSIRAVSKKPVRNVAPNATTLQGKELIEEDIRQLIADSYDTLIQAEDRETRFFDLGLDSAMLMSLVQDLENKIGDNLYPTLLFEYPNLAQLAEYIHQDFAEVYKASVTDRNPEPVHIPPVEMKRTIATQRTSTGFADDIAIIGLDGKYPQSDNLADFWNNIVQGTNCITEIPKDHWDMEPWISIDRNGDRLDCKWGGFIKNVNQFDPLFFKISPNEVQHLDPQVRLMLEVVWNAVEDAGYSPGYLSREKVGVYLGVMNDDFTWVEAENHQKTGQFANSGCFASELANRISYTMDFTGPSMTIETACSSSMTSLHMARMALLNNECTVAIAGGVNLSLHASKYRMLSGLKLVSPTGQERTFDKSADGYIPGEGVGAVVLKPLAKAEADRDHIYGVIKASAINHSGTGSGRYVPDINAISEVVETSLDNANLTADQVSYLEAHGSGTALGDPIEIKALAKAFGKSTDQKNYCALGTRSNFGHLESASGICSLTKVLLNMQQETIPQCVGVDEINPNIPIHDYPFYIPHQTQSWSRADQPRISGINSFGIGGSNSFVLVEEYDKEKGKNTNWSVQSHLIVISARDEKGLNAYVEKFLHYFRKGDLNGNLPSLAEMAYTLQLGREAMPERLATVVPSLDELRQRLEEYLSNNKKSADPLQTVISGRRSLKGNHSSNHKIPGSVKYLGSLDSTECEQLLADLAKAWIHGSTIDWNRLYQQEDGVLNHPMRVSLPTYPYDKKVYSLNQKVSGSEGVFIAERWVPGEFTSTSDKKAVGSGTTLVFTTGKTIDFSDDQDVDVVNAAETFSKVDERTYNLNFESKEDLERLIENLATERKLPDKIIVRASVSEEQELLDAKKAPFFLLHLTQALMRQKPKSEIRLVYLFEDCRAENIPYHAAISGICRTVRLENPKFIYKAVHNSAPQQEIDSQILFSELNPSADQEITVQYRHDGTNWRRYINKQVEIPGQSATASEQDSGKSDQQQIILITGGKGKLAQHLAQHLAKQANTSVILAGRSGITHDMEKSFAPNITYLKADVTKESEVSDLVGRICGEYGDITGIIHTAGVLRDSFLIGKTAEEMEQVLAPKVTGTRQLDEATKSLDLNYFVMFSSLTGAMGNLGQGDYAYANRFQDYFAVHREQLRTGGKRKGKTVSIQWPFWKEGGMQMTDSIIRSLKETSGTQPIETAEGIAAFEAALQQPDPVLAFVTGDGEKIRDSFQLEPLKTKANQPELKPELLRPGLATGKLRQLVEDHIKIAVFHVLGVEKENIHLDVEIGDYGFDSINFVSLSEQLSALFDMKITPDIFYEHTSFESFADYLCEFKAEHLNKVFHIDQFSGESTDLQNNPVHRKPSDNKVISNRMASEPIAVIGMEGRMPKSENLEEFWKYLEAGESLVSEIPEDRWDWKALYGDQHKESNRTNIIWGGFLNEVDKFDARFFGISPREAELMDPQQKLFIETVWKTLEEAGYKPSDLAGSNTGVFLGATGLDFQDSLKEHGLDIDAHTATGMSPCLIPNRVSYLFNWHGPSELIDTACSSSLVAVYHAVEAIRKGLCDTAIAGGTNIITSPSPYIAFSKAGMLSPDGKCKTFDKDANGYVRGEGVAALLLKPLSRAIADNDHIHAVIKSAVINHGGRVNTLTSPNPNLQAKLLIEAYEKAGVAPNSIDYIEAHGTGTSLGDPVEINGLKKAFQHLYQQSGVQPNETPHCALGSVKTNIGHLETAAGIAGVVKVLLAMKHGKIPASVHFQEINPYIDLSGSPFYIADKTREWLKNTKSGKHSPRRAGVSSFGFGGTNAHVVLEEYETVGKIKTEIATNCLLILSAASESQLRITVDQLLAFIKKEAKPVFGVQVISTGVIESLAKEIRTQLAMVFEIEQEDLDFDTTLNDLRIDVIQLSSLKQALIKKLGFELHLGQSATSLTIRELAHELSHIHKSQLTALFGEETHGQKPGVSYDHIDLADMAYTLQVGREAMNRRLALVTNSTEDVVDKLESWLEGVDVASMTGFYQGEGKLKQWWKTAKPGEQNDEHIRQLLAENNLQELASLWTEGADVDWCSLSRNKERRRISLPTTPFLKERFWLPVAEKKTTGSEPEQQRLYLAKNWRPSPFSRSKGESGKVAILRSMETFGLANELANHFRDALILDTENPVDDPAEVISQVDGWIDLVGCSSSEEVSLEWIPLLQELISKTRPKELRILGVTHGLESYQNSDANLVGAHRAGLYRMLQSEYPHLVASHLDLDPAIIHVVELAKTIADEYKTRTRELEICYRNKERFAATLKEITLKTRDSADITFKENDVLLITGGTRGLGLLSAFHFVAEHGVKKLVLTGREALPAKDRWHDDTLSPEIKEKIRSIQKLEKAGIQVEALALPLDDPDLMRSELKRISESMGAISGLIHAAGTVNFENPSFVRKSLSAFQSVLQPKVTGLNNLLSTLESSSLRFVVLFSSVSAQVPYLAAGQSDYAMANAYMDYVAQSSNLACPVVSIQWPSWKESGMGEVRSPAYVQSGLLTLSDEQGLDMLDQIVRSSDYPVIMPVIVNPGVYSVDKLNQNRIEVTPEAFSHTQARKIPTTQKTTFFPDQNWLAELFAKELRMDVNELDLSTPFQDYGADSILLAEISRQITQKTGVEIDPSVVFEHTTIEKLSNWLEGELGSKMPMQQSTVETITQSNPESRIVERLPLPAPSMDAGQKEKIAVVGMSCRFPGAANLDEYVALLAEGRNAITSVPKECWGVDNSYFAGLIEDIYAFDPEFFMIPREDARAMDPQALVLLEESLKTFYHSGYSLEEIQGRLLGVYIGARSQHRPESETLTNARNPILAVGQNYLAANISQFYNFQGPSLVVDTACSSVLVAMNLAVQALQNHEIEGALVGGVSLLTGPFSHQLFERRNLLAPDNRFHILDQRASGIVLGEGAGMVMLKTQQQAERDEDQVYATIQGIATNNDGRTPGPATPNIEAQKEVMKAALTQSGFRPEDIEYIDVNGSGSEVTDLLEIKAIESVYRPNNSKKCLLGSMKPNIGHPLCAEGIASFIKVVLMLNQGFMPPFLSGQQSLKHYPITASPFEFNRENKPWRGKLAALNSFADGGTNAHVILGSNSTK